MRKKLKIASALLVLTVGLWGIHYTNGLSDNYFKIADTSIPTESILNQQASECVSEDCFLVLKLRGGIDSSINSRRFRQLISDINNNKHIKGVVLYVTSPGGSAIISENMYQSLNRIVVPKVGFVDAYAFSGGYYILMAVPYIVATPNAFVGSIGVIAALPNFARLLDKIGVEYLQYPYNAYNTGILDPMSNESRAEFNRSLNKTLAMFNNVVKLGRQYKEEELNKVNKAQIYSAATAISFKMIDKIGNFTDATTYLKGVLNLSEVPTIATLDIYDLESKENAHWWEGLSHVSLKSLIQNFQSGFLNQARDNELNREKVLLLSEVNINE